MKSKWRRYEVLLPVRFNDGRDVPAKWLGKAANEIMDEFEGIIFDPEEIEGRWRHKGIEYRDNLVRITVDVRDTLANRLWVRKYKARWKRRLKQAELWVISYRIEIE